MGAAVLAGAMAAGAAAQSATPATELRLTLLHTSDEHSALLPSPFAEVVPGETHPSRGGFARLAHLVADVRAGKAAEGESVLLTSAGDYLSGSAFSWLALYEEAPELGLMVELGYDVVILGNHEFDYGSDRLAEYLSAAGFPAAGDRTALVATNTRPPPGHALHALGMRRTHLVSLPNGLRVGFIGLIGEGAQRFVPFAPPVEFEDARAAAGAAVAELRAAGAQLVVAITHSGLAEDRALARAVPGIDVILGGHDHRLLEEPVTEAGTVIVHPGTRLEQLLVLELGYDPTTGAIRVRNGDTDTPFVVPIDETVAENPSMAARVADYRRLLEARLGELTDGRFTSIGATVARSGFTLPAGPRLSETPFGNFVTDAMRMAVEAATGDGVDVVFQANGVIRGDLVPGAGPREPDAISLFDLAALVGMGFGPDGGPGYPLVSLWLTGAEVRQALEVSVLLSGLLGDSYFLQVAGLRARYDPRRAVLARIPFRGTPIPSGRAVLSAQREAGGRYLAIPRRDPELYHVVTDRYVASFLPLVGQLVPRLAIVPKDRHGRPIADLDATIVRAGGQELKVWHAVLDFAAAQPMDGRGGPRLSGYYATTAGRLVQVRATPLWLWPAIGLAVAIAITALWAAARWRRRRPGAATRTP